MDATATPVDAWYRTHARVYAHYGQPGGLALCSRLRRIPVSAYQIEDGDYNAKCCHCTNAQQRAGRRLEEERCGTP